MEVREQCLPLADEIILRCDWLLDLHDHVSLSIHLGSCIDDLRTSCDVVIVCESTTNTTVGFYDHIVAVLTEGFNSTRRESNTLLTRLDLLWYADQHIRLSFVGLK